MGALISATDPVSVLAIMKDSQADKTLYNIIFGESVFNDAAAIVLYATILKIDRGTPDFGTIISSFFTCVWIFFGSILIGSSIGMLVSFLLKSVSLKNRRNFEASAVIFGPWITYLVSEACDLSGIVSILFCGIFALFL